MFNTFHEKPGAKILVKPMKLRIKSVLAVAIFSLTSAGNAGAEYQSVVGSKHDLSANHAITGSLGACAYCHVADAGPGKVSARLNRNDPISTFTLYDSLTLDSEIIELGSQSLHCLSCHDGVTPFDALGDSSGTENNNMSVIYPGGPAMIGADLSGHHPVGVVVPDNEAFEELSAIKGAGLEIYDEKVECPTCHEVHGKNGIEYFLRINHAGASLCRACHLK